MSATPTDAAQTIKAIEKVIKDASPKDTTDEIIEIAQRVENAFHNDLDNSLALMTFRAIIQVKYDVLL